MVGQENFSSAARLKQSEAYQASESGIDAVRSWATNRSADVSALVTQYMNDRRPIYLNHLGKKIGDREQEFSAYLVGIDNTGSMGLKILVEGRGRDGSKVNQVAIIGISGLSRLGEISLLGWSSNSGGGKPNVPGAYGAASGTQGYLGHGRLQLDCTEYCANNSVSGEGTENTGGAVLIGNWDSTGAAQGFSTSGDAVITGSFNGGSISGMKVGCPIKPGTTNNPPQPTDLVDPKDTPRPSNYADMVKNNEVGNFYVKQNFSGGTIGMCGSVYIGGNMTVKGEQTVWGDLYVEGDLILEHKLTVYGNVTVKGKTTIANANPVDFKGNFVMLNQGSGNSTSNNNLITVGKEVCKNGVQTPLITNKTPQTSCPSSMAGGDILDYIGRNITLENGKYTIPEPVKMGSPEVWRTKAIPDECDARLKPNGTWTDANGIITFDANITASSITDAINACAQKGNWIAADSTNWLALRVNWNTINNFEDSTLNGNFIIIVENYPSMIKLPKTTKASNVLLWLTPNPNNNNTIPEIFIGEVTSTDNFARNYFIYSERDIKLNGVQRLTGNLFMAGGAKVNQMQDFRTQVNDELLKALGSAGIIKNNRECECDTPPPNVPPNFTPDDDEPWVPVSSQLSVRFKNKEITKEKAPEPGKFDNIKPSILVMPRIVFLTPDQAANTNTNLEDYYSFMFLNRAKDKPDLPPFVCTPQLSEAEGKRRCEHKATRGDNADVSHFYVYVGDISKVDATKSSTSQGNSSSNVPSSSSVAITCNLANNQQTYYKNPSCVDVPVPTVSCGTGISVNNRSFNYNNSNTNVWANNATTHSFCTTTTSSQGNPISLTGVTCGNIPYSNLNKSCGSIIIAEQTSNVSVECKLVNRNNAEVSSLTVKQGENIKAPKVTCTNGTASSLSFSTSGSVGLPQNSSNWQNNGNAYYKDTQAPGAYTISVSNNCGGNPFSNTTCGIITVEQPTCTLNGDYPVSTGVPAPTPSCGNASASSAKFNITDANDGNISSTLNWNNAPPSSHTFGNSYAGGVIRMYQISCDGNTLNYGGSGEKKGIVCGTINIVSASPLTFSGINESGALTNGTTYSITCSNTSKPVWCMHSNNAIWSYSINGGTSTVCGSGCNSNAIKVMDTCANNATIKITDGVSVKCKNRAGWNND
jgi:hypothetical protein